MLPSTRDPAEDLWVRLNPADREAIDGFSGRIPVPVGEIGRHFGIRITSMTLSPDISGLIRLTDDGTYEIQINNTDAPVRQRFTVAHELAHYFLHRSDIGVEGIQDSILYRSRLTNRQEAEANRLAAAILLPWGEVRRWHLQNFGCEPNRDNLDSLANAFRTSSLAVGFRLKL